MKALRLPTRVSAVTYFVRFRRPRDPPIFVSAVALLEELEVPSWPGRWVPVARSAGRFKWTPVGYLRSPGDPSCAFAPLLDPGRTDVPLPWRSHRYRPRFVRQRRLRTMRISGLTHAAFAPALLRFAFRVATHAQGWLPAGWLAFTGRASNPLDHYERFQFTWSSPFPVLLTLLTFRTRARLSFAPPTCRMPLGQSQDIPQANPGRRVTPRFWHHLSSFRHFCSGSLALASLNHTCRNHVPTFPQRSPPRLLTTAACGGLRSTPDCRPRRTYLHLSYSYASPFGPALLVTQDPSRALHRVSRRGGCRSPD